MLIPFRSVPYFLTEDTIPILLASATDPFRRCSNTLWVVDTEYRSPYTGYLLPNT